MGFTVTEWDKDIYASQLPGFDPDASKYTRGSLAVVGGSGRFPGAPVLAAIAAARTGAGYVTAVVPDTAAPAVHAHLLSIPVLAAPSRDGAFRPNAFNVLEGLRHLDAVVLGPGMGASIATAAFTAGLLDEVNAPVLLDADALNVVSGMGSEPRRIQAEAQQLDAFRALVARAPRGAETVLTPHDGELKRLADACERAGRSISDELSGELDRGGERMRNAVLVAATLGSVVVAKGRSTVIATGTGALVSEHATPALAKAGTGDVLSGVIGAFLANGLRAFEAAALGVYIHSRAGVIAAGRLGARSVMAEDVLEAIPAALVELEG